MKKAYYLFFYKLYYFFKAVADEGWEHWKALIAINTLEILFVVELLVWWTIATKKALDISPLAFAIPITIGVVFINYRIFLLKNNWKQIICEFEDYSKNWQSFTSWLVFILIAIILGSLIFAFYTMSQMDWSQYPPVGRSL